MVLGDITNVSCTSPHRALEATLDKKTSSGFSAHPGASKLTCGVVGAQVAALEAQIQARRNTTALAHRATKEKPAEPRDVTLLSIPKPGSEIIARDCQSCDDDACAATRRTPDRTGSGVGKELANDADANGTREYDRTLAVKDEGNGVSRSHSMPAPAFNTTFDLQLGPASPRSASLLSDRLRRPSLEPRSPTLARFGEESSSRRSSFCGARSQTPRARRSSLGFLPPEARLEALGGEAVRSGRNISARPTSLGPPLRANSQMLQSPRSNVTHQSTSRLHTAAASPCFNRSPTPSIPEVIQRTPRYRATSNPSTQHRRTPIGVNQATPGRMEASFSSSARSKTPHSRACAAGVDASSKRSHSRALQASGSTKRAAPPGATSQRSHRCTNTTSTRWRF